MLKLTKRINVTISNELNEFLDEESKRTGIAKSSLVAFAIEDFKTKTDEYFYVKNKIKSFLKERDLEN